MKLHFAKLFAKAVSIVGQLFKKRWKCEPRIEPDNLDERSIAGLNKSRHVCWMEASQPRYLTGRIPIKVSRVGNQGKRPETFDY